MLHDFSDHIKVCQYMYRKRCPNNYQDMQVLRERASTIYNYI